MKTNNKFGRRILRIFSILFVIGIIIFLGISYYTFSYANQITKVAQDRFHKSQTESLLALIESKDFSFPQKNQAIFVLGTLKDKKALPQLEALVTHQPCKHQHFVCQYELEKAILQIKGEYASTQTPFNAFLYKVTDGMVTFSYKAFSFLKAS